MCNTFNLTKADLKPFLRKEIDPARFKIIKLLHGETDEGKIIEMLTQSTDKDILMSPCYAIASRYAKDGLHEKRLVDMLGDHVFHTESQIGGVLVGFKDFAVNIPLAHFCKNEAVCVAEVNKSQWNPYMADYLTSLEGNFNIYNRDYEKSSIAKHMLGSYDIYRYNGVVIFSELHHP